MCQEVQALVRFETQELDPKNRYGALPFSLVTATTPTTWFLGNRGGLGLSPKSKFLKFVQDSYLIPASTGYIEMSLSYESTGLATQFNTSTSDFTGSKFIFNGRTGETDPIVQHFNAPAAQYWSVKGVDFDFGKVHKKIANTTVCVQNTQNFLIAIGNKEAFIEDVKKAACKGYGEKDDKGVVKTTCFKSDFNIDKAPQIKFTITDKAKKSTTVVYEPVDYIYYADTNKKDKDERAIFDVKFAIENYQDYSSQCDPNSSVIVGRLFLLKTEFIIQLFDGKLFVGFNETVKKGFNIYLIILVLMGILIAALIISIVLLKTCQRMKSSKDDEDAYEEDAEYYNKVEEEA